MSGGVSKSGLGVSGSRGHPEKSMMLPAIGEDEEYPQPPQIEGSSNPQIENSYHISARNFFFSNGNRVRVLAPSSIEWNSKNGRSDPRHPTPARSATASVCWWLYNHTPTTVCRHGNPTSASWRPATTTASDAVASGSSENNGSEWHGGASWSKKYDSRFLELWQRPATPGAAWDAENAPGNPPTATNNTSTATNDSQTTIYWSDRSDPKSPRHVEFYRPQHSSRSIFVKYWGNRAHSWTRHSSKPIATPISACTSPTFPNQTPNDGGVIGPSTATGCQCSSAAHITRSPKPTDWRISITCALPERPTSPNKPTWKYRARVTANW